MAKMHLVPIRRGYWGKNSGLPHTIPMKLSGTWAPSACASSRRRAARASSPPRPPRRS